MTVLMTVLWKKLDHPGHEWCRLSAEGDAWILQGVAVFAYRDAPCRLAYRIRVDERWNTLSASLSGAIGGQPVALDLAADAGRRWWLGSREVPGVAGCADVDLAFSPSTNLLPIRRLALEVGQEAAVRAAWVEFPSLHLQLLEQRYRREQEGVFHYESDGGRFARDLVVNEAGFVIRYPDFWEMEASA